MAAFERSSGLSKDCGLTLLLATPWLPLAMLAIQVVNSVCSLPPT